MTARVHRLPAEAEIATTLGVVMREVREDQHRTGEAVAAQLGYSDSVVGMWERGERITDAEQFLAWCAALRTDPRHVLHVVENRLRMAKRGAVAA